MSVHNPEPYSYYFDKLSFDMYNFNDKEICLRNYMTYMFNRTQKIFEYENLPDTIPKRMLEMLLQINGFACVTKVNGELYALWGGLGGEPDPYYRPTLCVVANPALKYDKTLKIDKDCVIVRNDSFLYGLVPLFRRYASAMVENDISFRMAAINTRIEALLSAPDDNTKEAAEKYLRDVENGKLGVIAANEFLDGIKAQPMTSSLRTFTDLIEYQQYIKASWFNELGLNANYNMKREKLSTTESQMNNDALLPLVDDMLEQRRVCLEKVNEMFGTNIKVSFASSWEKMAEEFQAELDDLKFGESNQLDGGEENVVSEDAEVSDGLEVPDSSVGTELREDDDAGVVDENHSGDGEEMHGTEEVQSADDSDGGVNIEVNVEVNVDGDSGEEEESDVSGDDESDESIRDSDTE